MNNTPDTADGRLRALYEREWDWRREQFAGRDDEDSVARAADHLPRVDADAQARREAYWREVLGELDAIPAAELSEGEATNAAVFRFQIESLHEAQRFRTWQMPFNSDTAFWTDLGFTARRPHHTALEIEQYLGKLADIPRYFAEHIDNLRAGLARGFTPPRVTLGGCVASVEQILAAPSIEANLYYTPLRHLPAHAAPTDAARWRGEAATLIRDAVLPAHVRLRDFLRDTYVLRARATLPARALPDGEAFYRSQIRAFTTLDMAPEAIHALGLAEVTRLREEMQATAHQADFDGTFDAFLDFLRHDKRFYPQSAEALLREAAWIAKRVDGCIGEFIGRLPRKRFAIRPVPAELAPTYTTGRGGPGMYLVNTSNLPARPLYALPALTLHEAEPGHSLQMALAAEHEGLPAFRRHQYLSAFAEGWALYCERLGVEMGLYETPYQHFGYLAYQAWRAARLVVDTGIHHLGWSREEACAYLRANTALSEHEIGSEVGRYIGWPAQALCYYLGQMHMLKARAKAERALGARFDLRAFHDAILALGSVPLPMLDAATDAFIARGGTSPWAA